jgi:hypothetical protein
MGVSRLQTNWSCQPPNQRLHLTPPPLRFGGAGEAQAVRPLTMIAQVDQERRQRGLNVSPRVFKEGELVFWFHSYDVLWENRASIHVGKGSQHDTNDAKIWLEPQIEVARAGRTLSRIELNQALQIIEHNLGRLLEAWNAHKRKTS